MSFICRQLMQPLILEWGTTIHDFQQRTTVLEGFALLSDFQKCALLLVRNGGNLIVKTYSPHHHGNPAFCLAIWQSLGPTSTRFTLMLSTPTLEHHISSPESEPDSLWGLGHTWQGVGSRNKDLGITLRWRGNRLWNTVHSRWACLQRPTQIPLWLSSPWVPRLAFGL